MPNSGGVYAIHQLARECSKSMEVNLVVESDVALPVDGVAVHALDLLDEGGFPEADALIIHADTPRGEALFGLPPDAGVPIAFFQGYGTPGNEMVVENLTRANRAIVGSDWLVPEARRFGCATRTFRYACDRSIFFPGPPTGDRPPSAVMMTSESPWKGTDEGVQALALARQELDDLEINFFGHVEPRLEGASFTPAPPAQRPQIAALMRHSMVFVCSSWEEGLGLPGIEAMACGAAVATTDTKGSRDYAFPGRTALVSEPHAPEQLAANIVRLVRNERLRRRCVKRGRRRVDRTYRSWEEAGASFARSMHELVA
jgi:glycosyltransferase involved in cell wall biosynthesis